MKGAPVVGNGLGGLPRRAVATAAAPTPTVPIPLLSSALRTSSDRALGFRVNHNSVISDTVGSYQASGNYSSSIHVVMRNHPMFTLLFQETGGSSMWPPGYACESYHSPRFVSLTYGGESNFNTRTLIFGFAEDFLYRARSTSNSTSVISGFMIDGDASSFYVFGSGVVSRVSKTTLTTVASKAYNGAVINAAWVRGQNIVFLDVNARVFVIDKDTLDPSSSFTLPNAQFQSSSAQTYSQTNDVFAWVGGASRDTVFILDKATLDVRSHTLPWNGGGRYVHMFVCNNRICIVTFDGATSPASGLSFEYTATTRRQLLSFSGTNWSEQGVVQSGCYYGDDIFTISNLTQGSQSIGTTVMEWSFRLSTFNGSSIPTFTGTSISWSGSTANLDAVTKTTVSVSANNTTSEFVSFTRFPYRTFY
jgi:hypothetical protein